MPTGRTPDERGITDAPLPFTGGRLPASPEEMALVSRRVAMQLAVAPAISFAALLGGFYLGRPRVAALGVMGLGLTAVWIGGLAVLERRLMSIRPGLGYRRDRMFMIYEGIAAVPWGLAYALGGSTLIAAVVLYLGGTSPEQMRDHVLARPAIGLVPLGAMLLCQGLALLIGFVDRRGTAARRFFGRLFDAPARLGGLILTVWGAALLGVGLVDWLAPTVFLRWFESMTGNPWPFV